MNLQGYFSELCKNKSALRVQCNTGTSIAGKIVLSEDDFIVLRPEDKTLSHETLVPHSAILAVVEIDEVGNPKLFTK